MANSHAITLPPDSTGKKIRVKKFIEIPYTGMTELIEAGDHIRVRRAGNTVLHGNVIFVSDSAGSGMLGIIFHSDHQTPSTGVEAADTIERQEGTTYVQRAVASGDDIEYYFNANTTVSADNPFYGQRVDQYGAAYTRFTEGAVTFDATGRQRQANNTPIAAHSFNDLEPLHFTPKLVNGGTVAHNSTQNSVVLTTTGVAGDESHFIGKKYLYSDANTSTFATMVVRVGDSGKTNVEREWGIYNEEMTAGFMFVLDGTALKVRLLNSTSGSTVMTEVAQADWSDDTLGSGINNPSGFKLDVTKVNHYWFEMIQNGGGLARMGVFNTLGVRIICHTFTANNVETTGFMHTGSFPLHCDQHDAGGGSTSEMFLYSATAELEGPNAEIQGKFYEGCSDPIAVSSLTDWTPLFSIRPKALNGSGDVNRNVVLPKLISIDAIDDNDRATERRVKIEVFLNGVLTGDVWAKTKGNTETDYRATYGNDLGATLVTGGTAVAEWIIRGNAQLDATAVFNYLDKYLVNDADGTQNVITVAAKALDQGVTVSCVCAITWEEVDSQ